MSYINYSEEKEISPNTQLCYVLPIESHYLIPETIKNKISKNHGIQKI